MAALTLAVASAGSSRTHCRLQLSQVFSATSVAPLRRVVGCASLLQRRLASSSGGSGATDGGDATAGDAAAALEPKDYDLYAVLGVRRGASPEEIKAGYRQVAKECHPDVSQDPTAAARFRAANHAHTTLLHVSLRRMYDLHLHRQAGRERCEREAASSGALARLSQRRPVAALALGAAAGSLATCVAVLVFAASLGLFGGDGPLAARYPGLFWTFFRNVPDWMPGKWRLAELYNSGAAARNSSATNAGPAATIGDSSPSA
eukprot:TRINITY_DN3848_c1_g1_i1.p1 TRINITY_DN3848_c1_g1~~TRINITY_DN3848_c1_g1_i1.p1  ORF type:complete len:270 (-),score=34.46 TRINITY_DN3848_c1_g1_i1:98-880(-)